MQLRSNQCNSGQTNATLVKQIQIQSNQSNSGQTNATQVKPMQLGQTNATRVEPMQLRSKQCSSGQTNATQDEHGEPQLLERAVCSHLVCVAYSGQSVSDDDDCSVLHGVVDRLLDQVLTLRIQRTRRLKPIYI